MRLLMQLVVIFALLLAQNLLVSSAARGRQNLFDPIYAYDDIDAHTVSVGQQQSRPEATRKQRADSYQRSLLDDDDDSPTFNRLPVSTASLPPITTLKKTTNVEPKATAEPKFSQTSSESPMKKSAKKGEERHWSALENYYQKLRQPASSVANQQTIQQVLTDPLSQQDIGDSLIVYKPIQNISPYSQNIGQAQLLKHTQNSAPNQAFLLPIIDGAIQSQHQALDNDFGYAVHKTSVPSVSVKGGIGAGSIMLERPTQIDYSQPQQQPSRSQSRPIVTEGGKVKYLEWRKLPELLLIQQQQQRVKHQQETFGSWYDHQRSRELLQEEVFCGPRNYINFHLVPITSLPGSSRIAAQPQLNPLLLSRLQTRIDPNGEQDVPVALSAGEYPSHVGIYNDTKTSDDNFVCAATWIHESFAITLASCVRSYNPQQLFVRAGEWNLNRKNNQTNSTERTMITREVQRIHVFPKYRNDSNEHNLALIEFKRPIEFLEVPYICPACQLQSRSMLKTSSCWTPVRNVTFSEYFDAEGEGETKEKRNVNMIELPVRLAANDDNECFRQTSFEFFNFQHPNYICSADIKSAVWRARLNQTDYFGSGIYCNEGGNLSLVSILHPIYANSSSAFGYMDLSYYKPWIRNVISGRTF